MVSKAKEKHLDMANRPLSDAANPHMLLPKSNHGSQADSSAHHSRSRSRVVDLPSGVPSSNGCNVGVHAKLAPQSEQTPQYAREDKPLDVPSLHEELVALDLFQAPYHSWAQPHSTRWSAGHPARHPIASPATQSCVWLQHVVVQVDQSGRVEAVRPGVVHSRSQDATPHSQWWSKIQGSVEETSRARRTQSYLLDHHSSSIGRHGQGGRSSRPASPT